MFDGVKFIGKFGGEQNLIPQKLQQFKNLARFLDDRSLTGTLSGIPRGSISGPAGKPSRVDKVEIFAVNPCDPKDLEEFFEN